MALHYTTIEITKDGRTAHVLRFAYDERTHEAFYREGGRVEDARHYRTYRQAHEWALEILSSRYLNGWRVVKATHTFKDGRKLDTTRQVLNAIGAELPFCPRCSRPITVRGMSHCSYTCAYADDAERGDA